MIFLIVVYTALLPQGGNTEIYNVGSKMSIEVCEAVVDGLRIEEGVLEANCYENK